jgi:hypothetical protein
VGRRFAFFGGLSVALVGALLALFASIANGPDFDLSFTREVPSTLDAKTLDEALRATVNWPRWFFSLADAKIVDVTGLPFPLAAQTVSTGSIVRLSIDPKKGRWKKFVVQVRVSEYVPGKRLSLHVLSDSKNRLDKYFDRLDWTVDLLPTTEGKGTLIRGTELAHTSYWRTRLFGRIASRIMMNQVFYPDLIQLGVLTRPSPPVPPSPFQ